jgi:hypothetical protein
MQTSINGRTAATAFATLVAFTMLTATTAFAQSSYEQPRKHNATGNGVSYTQTLPLADFTAIEIGRQVVKNIIIEVGAATASMEIVTDENFKNVTQVSCENGVLRLSSTPIARENTWNRFSDFTQIRIKTPRLSSLLHSDNSNVTLTGVTGDAFRLTNGQNGDVRLAANVTQLDISNKSNGNVTMTGTVAKTLTATNRANGDIILAGAAGYCILTNKRNGDIKADKMITKGFAIDKSGNGTIIAPIDKNVAAVSTATDDRVARPNNTAITFYLQNKSVLPRNITLISYAPNETGNSTQGFTLAPFDNVKVTFEVGTRLFLADNKQVDIVMSGKSINNNIPFMTVQAADAGKKTPLQ